MGDQAQRALAKVVAVYVDAIRVRMPGGHEARLYLPIYGLAFAGVQPGDSIWLDARDPSLEGAELVPGRFGFPRRQGGGGDERRC